MVSKGKKMKGDNDYAIKEHHLFCNHQSGFDDFFILASNNNFFLSGFSFTNADDSQDSSG